MFFLNTYGSISADSSRPVCVVSWWYSSAMRRAKLLSLYQAEVGVLLWRLGLWRREVLGKISKGLGSRPTSITLPQSLGKVPDLYQSLFPCLLWGMLISGCLPYMVDVQFRWHKACESIRLFSYGSKAQVSDGVSPHAHLVGILPQEVFDCIQEAPEKGETFLVLTMAPCRPGNWTLGQGLTLTFRKY